MRSRPLVFLGGALAGAALGWIAAQRHIERHQSDLFSPRPLRRMSALGYLAGQEGVEAVGLLRDYVRWESQPILRQRAEAVLRRMEATLG